MDWEEIRMKLLKGVLCFIKAPPDLLQFFKDEQNGWKTLYLGNRYSSITTFPSHNVPSGWLRSLIHAHYLFFGGTDTHSFVPGIKHGLAVQRLVCNATEYLLK